MASIAIGVAGVPAATTAVSSFSKSGQDAQTGSTATAGGSAGSTAAGNAIDWVLSYRNNTGGTADVNISDPLTGNQTFVPGSLKVPPGFTGTEPAGGVNAVGAVGRSVPGSNGLEGQTQPGPAPFQSTGGGGDGYDALFVGQQIYNVRHHNNGNVLDCHNRDGTRCTGYPTSVSGIAGQAFGTNGQPLTTAQVSAGAVFGTKIYYPVGVIGSTDIGVACADVSTKTSCGFKKLGTAFNQGGGGSWIQGGAVADGKFYLADVSARVLCYDPSTDAQCAGYPLTNVADPGSGNLVNSALSIESWDDRYLFGAWKRASNNRGDIICIDTDTNAACPGFPKVEYGHVFNGNSYGIAVVPILNASGGITGICGNTAPSSNSHPYKCFDLQGNEVSTPFSTTQTAGTGVNWLNFGSIEVIGPRVYFAESTPGGIATYTCWDYSTAAPCANFTKATTNQVTKAYSLRQDPVNPDCIWEEGDADRFEVFSATFGGTNCTQAASTIEIDPSAFYCDGQGGHVQGWDELQISGVTAQDYNGLSVTIRDANGDAVPGWTSRVFPSGTTSIDISSIPASGSTSRLTIATSLNALAANKTATIRALFSGDPVQVCFKTQVGPAQCTATTPVSNSATAVTNAGAAGSDAPGGNDSGSARFDEAADPTLCHTDLSITKTVDDREPSLGQTIHYQLVVKNNGPNPAPNVTVDDVVGPGVNPVSATPSRGSCSSANSCSLGDFAVGDTATIDITADAVAEGTTGNTATVKTTVPETNEANNTASETVDVQPLADVRIKKTASATEVDEGDDFTYELTVVNDGPSTAKDVTVTDSLPAGVALRSASSSTGSCLQDDPVVCKLGDMARGAEVTITLRVTATGAGEPQNTAIAESPTRDPNKKNNQDSTKVTTKKKADLAILKSATPSVMNTGEGFDYVLDVVNNGPSRASNAVVTDTVPDRIKIQSVTSSRGICTTSGQTIVCELGDMAKGATAKITIAALTTKKGSYGNTASVTSETPDAKPENNTDPADIEVVESADIGVAKTASAATASVGDTVTYSITVTNHGPDDAANVTASDPLPEGSEFISANPSTGSCGVALGVLVCNLGPIADRAAVTIEVQVRLTQAGTTRDAVCITSPTKDPQAENNCAETEETVEKADVVVTKTPSTTSPVVGSTVTYTITATNNGPGNARGVVITDPIPATLEYVSAEASVGECAFVESAVVCNLGDLAAGASASATVRAIVKRVGDAGNGASAQSRSTSDPAPGNNVAGTEVRAAPSKLRLRKVVNRRQVRVGQTFIYRLRVTNPGSTRLIGVQVCDPLPSGVRYLSSSLPPRRVAGRLCWKLGALGARRSRTITLLVETGPRARGRKVNRATATAFRARRAADRAATRVLGDPCAVAADGPTARIAC